MKTNQVVVEKVKVVKAEKPEVKTEATTQPEPEKKETTILAKFEKTVEKVISKLNKVAGDYDGQYQKSSEEEDLPGVPGVKGEGDYDGQYQKAEPEAPEPGTPNPSEGHPEPDSDDVDGEPEDDTDEMEECTCEACGSRYMKKKAKKAEEEEEEEEGYKAPEDGKKMEEEEEEVLPKKAELSAEAWHKLFGQPAPKQSKAMTDWKNACNSMFNNNAFPTKE